MSVSCTMLNKHFFYLLNCIFVILSSPMWLSIRLKERLSMTSTLGSRPPWQCLYLVALMLNIKIIDWTATQLQRKITRAFCYNGIDQHCNCFLMEPAEIGMWWRILSANLVTVIIRSWVKSKECSLLCCHLWWVNWCLCPIVRVFPLSDYNLSLIQMMFTLGSVVQL